MATVIDTLFLELGIDSSKFSGEATKAEQQYDRLEQSVSKTEKAEKKAEKTTKENAEARRKSVVEHNKANESLKQFGSTVTTVVRGFAAFTAMLLGASGLSKLAVDAAKANRELDDTAKNLGIARKELQAWGGVADMAGGNANGMSGYMKTLSGDMQNLIMMGDTSVLPYFNALGVSLLDSSGKARKLDSVMLDLADRFSNMDRQQAYTLAQQMGIDDGTFNTLVRGRAEMERMLELQRDMYHSSEADVENARKLAEARGLLNARWESLKLMIGNAVLPAVIFLTQKVSDFVYFLSKHEHLTKGVFFGMAAAIGMVLMPMLITATAAVFAFIAPFIPLIAAVTALGAAFGLLYDDYKVWSEGGKSLFDWGKFDSYIRNSKVSTDSLGKSFIYLTTGYTSWSEAANGLLDWMKLKGFMDDNTISARSLANGFKNLASEIADGLMPYLMDIVNIFERLKEGDFSGAGEAVKVAVKRRWEAAKAIGGAMWDRMTGAADVATGHEMGTAKETFSPKTSSAGSPKGWRLGNTSMKYETSGRGAGTVSTGEGDYGGVSYGSYQMSSRMGVVQKFIAQSKYKNDFAGLVVNSEAFKAKWKSLAKNDPEFEKAQHDYIKKTHYDPLVRNLKQAGLNLSGRGAAVQDAIWSTAVQYGGGSKVIQLALAGKNVAAMSDSDLVSAIQDYKHDKTQLLFSKSPKRWAGLRKRALQEKADLLKLARSQSGLNQPLGGQAVAGNLQSQQTQIQAANSAAKPQQVSNQNSTQVTVNGGIHVKTTADTVRGTAEDAAAGMFDRVSQYAVSQG